MNKTDKQVHIYPSLLSDQRVELQNQLQQLAAVDPNMIIQFDIIDGKFADNLTCTPTDLSELNVGQLQFDFHLMTEEPMDFVHELIDMKDRLNIRAVIGQVERMSSQAHFLKEVQQQQWLPGLSLDLYTHPEVIDEDSWPIMKIVQVMAVEAGFQGQQFHPAAIGTLRELQPRVQEHELEAIVDGGINLDTINQVVVAGATGAVVGSALWSADNLTDLIHQLQSAVHPQ